VRLPGSSGDALSPTRSRNLPLRTCVGCRTVRPRTELVRIALPAVGPAALDRRGRLEGRGAYLCRERSLTCLAAARRRRSLLRALRTTPDRLDLAALEAALEGPAVVAEVSSSPS